jgi:membrane-associated phospholipid phosphatase
MSRGPPGCVNSGPAGSCVPFGRLGQDSPSGITSIGDKKESPVAGDIAPPAPKEAMAWLRANALWLIAAVVVFGLSALPIDAIRVSRAETELFRFFNELPGGIYWGMWAVMQFGNFLMVPLLTVVAAAFRRFRLAAAIAISGTLVWVFAKVIKDLIERGRPAELIDDVVLRNAPAAGNGYISGHAAVVAALAMVLSPYLGPRMRVVVWSLAALVCIARIYVGAHLPLDVVGGVAFGLAVGVIVNLFVGNPEHAGILGGGTKRSSEQ